MAFNKIKGLSYDSDYISNDIYGPGSGYYTISDALWNSLYTQIIHKSQIRKMKIERIYGSERERN